MKNARILFALVGFGALTLGITFADPPSGQTSDQSAGHESNENPKTSDHPADPGHGNQTLGDKDQTDKTHSQSNPDGQIPEKVSQAGPTKTPPKHPSDNKPSQPTPALNNTPAVAKDGSLINKSANASAQIAKAPVGGGTAALGSNIVRKPAGPTASIGGLSAASIKTSTAGISGTGMNHKP